MGGRPSVNTTSFLGCLLFSEFNRGTSGTGHGTRVWPISVWKVVEVG